MAVEPVDIKITLSGHVEANTGFRLVAEGAKVASSAVAMFTKHLERASTLLNSSKFAPLVDGLAKLQVGATATTTALSQVAPAAQQAGQAIQRTGHHAHGSGTSVDYLRSQVQRLLLLFGTREVFVMLDTFTNASDRLRLVAREGDTVEGSMERLGKLAVATRASFEGTVELYARLGLATKQLGTGSETLTRVVELTNKAIRLSGATARESAAGQIQFSQALASNRFQGDELRSVLETLPRLGVAIAEGLGVTTAGLRKMGEQGLLTTELVMKALLSQGDRIDREFKNVRNTIDAGLENLRTRLIQFLGEIDKSLGIVDKIFNALKRLGEVLGTIGPLLISVTAGWVAFHAAVKIGALIAVTAEIGGLAVALGIVYDKLILIGGFLARHPYAAAAAALVSLVTAMLLLGKEVELFKDPFLATVSLSEFVVGFGAGLRSFIFDGLPKLLMAIPNIFANIGKLSMRAFLSAIDTVAGALRRAIGPGTMAGYLAAFQTQLRRAMPVATFQVLSEVFRDAITAGREAIAAGRRPLPSLPPEALLHTPLVAGGDPELLRLLERTRMMERAKREPGGEELKDMLAFLANEPGKKATKEIDELALAVNTSLINAFGRATESLAEFFVTGEKGALNFSKLLQNLAVEMANIALQRLILAPLLGLFNIPVMFAGTAARAPDQPRLPPSAHGNILDPFMSDIPRAARGMLLDRPTLLAGEAGPEAVVPLRRTRTGDLGVMVAGAGAASAPVEIRSTVIVNVPPGSASADAEALGAAAGAAAAREFDARVMMVVARESRPGGAFNRQGRV